MVRIEVVQGDITEEVADAVVTAANESLLGGGGVDGAIHAAAGPELAETGSRLGPCDPGDAKVTAAFGLSDRFRWIVHTVGPVWDGGAYGEAELLASCYRRGLEVADEIGASTLAVPAIATGIILVSGQRGRRHSDPHLEDHSDEGAGRSDRGL